MPLFGISKNQAQQMIDAAMLTESNARAAADNANAAAIDAERNVRFASDKSLADRIVLLEGDIEPPPEPLPAPTAVLTLLGVENTSDTQALVLLSAQVTPENALKTIDCSDLTALPGAKGTQWIVTRGAVASTVEFTLTAAANGKSTTAKCLAPIDARPTAPPDPQLFELTITADRFKIDHSLTLQWDHDHWSNWGQPGEAISVNVHTEKATHIKMWFDYVLARESAGQDTVRDVSEVTAMFDVTCELWSAPIREWTDQPVEFDLPEGDSNLQVAVPEDSAAWSNWLDLYAARLVSDQPITVRT